MIKVTVLVLLTVCQGCSATPEADRAESKSTALENAKGGQQSTGVPRKKQDDSAELAIRAAYQRYVQAVTDKDGEAAAELVDERTLVYYDTMLALTLRGTPSAIKEQELFDKVMVLRLRHVISVDQLRGITGRKLLSLSVERGWVSAQSFQSWSLGEITINGKSASASVLKDGKASLHRLQFASESGAWKANVTSLFSVGNAAMSRVQKTSGKSEDDFAVFMVENMSKSKVSPEIWRAP